MWINFLFSDRHEVNLLTHLCSHFMYKLRFKYVSLTEHNRLYTWNPILIKQVVIGKLNFLFEKNKKNKKELKKISYIYYY